MCKDCFLQEPRVVAFADWKQFATLVATKVAAGQLLKGAYVVDYLRGKEDATQLYICTGCQQRWWAREPWYPYGNAWEQGHCFMQRSSFWARLFGHKKR